MRCQLDGCIKEGTEIYVDKETMQNIYLCIEHYERAMNIENYDKLKK